MSGCYISPTKDWEEYIRRMDENIIHQGSLFNKLFSELLKRIEDIEQWKENPKRFGDEFRASQMNATIDTILSVIGELNHLNAHKKPHKCPVCEGEGKNPDGPEDGEIRWGRCHACEGKGIVWG